jgi:enoyl-CoA hydratase
MSVRVEREDRVALVTLDRPEQLNALSNQLMNELVGALEELDADPEIRCIVLAGNDRAFAAGADIAEMASATAMDMLRQRRVEQWDAIRGLRTPLVAAVSGFCLGGGCELAMACDLIVASETAKFGQPETGLGIIPGAGGTQRLARTIGKQLAMELVLTGRRIDAREAHRIGIVNQVTRKKEWLDKAVELAEVVARRPPVAVRLAKQAVLAAEETALSAGLEYERRLYELAMATEDRIEGMTAFIEKRLPQFKGR